VACGILQNQIFLKKKNMKYRAIIFIAGIIFSLLLGVAFFDLQNPKTLRVTFFNIGQGDAALIYSPLGKKIIIDTGLSGSNITKKIAEHIPWYSNYIDILMLTHFDADHMGGAERIVREFNVGMIILPYSSEEHPFVLKMREYNVPVTFVGAGARIEIEEGLVMDFFWPIQAAYAVFGRNNASLVARMVYNDNSILFTGDIEKRIEALLPLLTELTESDVLKVSHHGSKTGTAKEFLDLVNPSIAIISVGENTYGHPNNEVLERLSGMEVLRTDVNGDITLIYE